MIYDLIVLGAGPAGLTAGLYGARGKLKTLVIEKGLEGGQISTTTDVENYPGTPNISGFELSHTIKKQAETFGAEFVLDEVVEAELEGKVKKIKTKENEYEAKTVIISTGAKSRKLGFAGEDLFEGKGISYCATCDAAFYQDFDVYVIGGGDSAIDEALFIAKFAKNVYIIHRRNELRASKSLQDRAFNNEKVHFIWNSVVEEIKGNKMAEELVIRNLETGELTTVKQNGEPFGIFIFVGYIPETKIFEGQVDMEKGYIRTDEEMNTNIDGVFAAGDLRIKSLRQVVTATADGAIAAVNAEKYIAEQEGNEYKSFEENK
ncbi:thioredoxin reductase (NADPH) [Anaerosphaera aminiphila DSM 21120]|uniref:Thioredoxin reductase n=1 Tax=Anaerosphaera aminiphila DSM 21120 TaxID=1120995 RepID=A0A1M5R3P9_9FIRM|nr:thioredoxin reductase (NADPH) [Anaerosphaera aminiphila DSM 21120]